MSPSLRLYTAPDCCLCDALKEQLAALAGEVPFTLETVDISVDAELELQYRTEIPVLYIDDRKAVKYRITTEELRRRLLHAQRGE